MIPTLDLKTIIIIGVIVAYAAIVTYAFNLKSQLAICNSEKAVQNYAVLQQVKAGEEAKKRVAEAEKAAELHRAESDKSILGLMNEEAPAECCAAIQWGMAHPVP